MTKSEVQKRSQVKHSEASLREFEERFFLCLEIPRSDAFCVPSRPFKAFPEEKWKQWRREANFVDDNVDIETEMVVGGGGGG